jgi:ankyrin repeat protein
MLFLKEGCFQPSRGSPAKCLSIAIENDMLDLVQIIPRKGESLVDVEFGSGQTALFWAARTECEAVVKLLLQAGADPKKPDNASRDTLEAAARNGYEGVVTLLLNAGANQESRHSSGLPPLSWAAQEGHEAVVKVLLESGANPEDCASS